MSRKVKTPKPPKIVRKLRDEKQVLHFSWGPEGGKQYWLEPSNKNVTEPAALKAITYPGVRSLRDSLFDATTPQSWGWGGSA